MIEVVKIKDLENAIVYLTNLSKEDAKKDAGYILNFFGFTDCIIDNALEPKYRDLFYVYEDVGLLKTEREETVLYDGRLWRTHYWVFKKEKIKEALEKYKKEIKLERPEPEPVYSPQFWEKVNKMKRELERDSKETDVESKVGVTAQKGLKTLLLTRS